jgi:cobalt-zinc-cadmium efflux system outer membrane protein
MRWLSVSLLAAAVGCQACHPEVPLEIEGQVAATCAAADVVPCAAQTPMLPESPGLPALWNLALANHPELREAAADVEAALGRRIQAAKYPNPRILYEEEELGTQAEPAGSIRVEVSQEIVTAGKRRLDIALADRDTDRVSLSLLGRKFDILTRVRRAYNDYLVWVQTAAVNDKIVAILEEREKQTRDLLKAGTGLPADVPRIRALLEEARINQKRSRISRDAAWRQLAAAVGVPGLPMPPGQGEQNTAIPQWDLEPVMSRVLVVHTERRQAALEVERARLEVERARAEAVPDIQVGGGYSRNFPEHEAGAVLSVETALPLWDRKQGRIHEAMAHLGRAQAAERSAALRLSSEVEEAFARYQNARQQVEQLQAKVVPELEKSLDLVREAYRVGAKQLTFADVLLAEQSLAETQLRLADARRELWRAIADLQGLMQLEVGEE